MRLLFGLLALLPVLAAAETGYVTDRLMLGLHQAEDTSDRPFRSLESGTAFEILSRDRLYAHVRLADGTEGYVKAAYVVDEPPAKLIVNQAQAEVERLTRELEEAKAAFAEPAAVIDSLKSQAATLESELEAARARLDDLEEDNAKYQRRAERYQYSLPYTWVGGAIAVCLIAGFLGGLWWVDHRSRKRHGGVRIY
ncbi:MAG TPA: TIGR04211 family SH3 domain-containing protein [Woeseiaceae bacterium]|nr:TIGR04211 family SH3 domain-containing protein [Woeseiaceae bacterium]